MNSKVAMAKLTKMNREYQEQKIYLQHFHDCFQASKRKQANYKIARDELLTGLTG